MVQDKKNSCEIEDYFVDPHLLQAVCDTLIECATGSIWPRAEYTYTPCMRTKSKAADIRECVCVYSNNDVLIVLKTYY